MARAISVIISGSAAPLRKAIREATDSLAGMSKGSVLAFSAATTATTMFAKSAIQAAAADQKQQALLARQLQVSAGATREQVAAVEQYIDATQRSVAVSDTELRTAYQSLAVATKDLASSQDLLNVSIDVAAATGRSTTSVAEALAKGYAGNTRALAQLSPELKKAIKDGADFSQVLDILRQNFAGAGAEASGTMAGQLAILGNTIDEAKESIGAALLPALQALLPAFVNLANWAGQNASLLGTLGVVIGAFTGVIVIAKGALTAWRTIAAITTAANLALGLSFTAVQVATGVGIVTALAAIPVYYKMKGVFDGLKTSTNDYTAALGNAITSQKQLNEYMGPVPSRNLSEFQKHYSAIGDTTPNVSNGLKTAAEKAKELAAANKERLATALKTAKDRLDALKESAKSYADGLADQIFGTVNLSDALKTATDREKDYTDALDERRAAYEELAKINVTTFDAATGRLEVANAEDLAAARERVAKAEAAVNATQAKKTDYASVFRAQIETAKTFATRLKDLIAAGLGPAGVQQLLNLGPVAGAEVAKQLLDGTAGLTLGELNLSPLEAAAAGLGAAGAGQMFGTDIARAEAQVANVTYANDIKITVTSADPDKVVEALVRWAKKNGSLPKVVQVS